MDTEKTKLQKQTGAAIKKKRIELRLTLVEAEKLSNIAIGNISNIENGKINLTAQTIEIFANAYNSKASFKLTKLRNQCLK